MNTLLLSLISQYRNIIAKDGEVEDYELREWLKLDPELPERYKEPDKLDKVVAKILEAPKMSLEKRYIQRAELYNLGMTDAQIADMQNVNIGAIRAWRTTNNLEPNISIEETAKQADIRLRNDEILKLYNLGYNDKEIADQLEEATSTVRAYLRSKGLKTNYRAGGKNGKKANNTLDRKAKINGRR